jgi:hypothetical protein
VAMDERVGFFRIGAATGEATAPAAKAASGPRRQGAGSPAPVPNRSRAAGNGAAGRQHTVGAIALKDPDWKEF